MITGKIVNNQEAIIELELTGVVHPQKIEAVIDTGFTEELMLPSDLIERLGLPQIGELRITLGDGNGADVGLYLAIVEWQDEKTHRAGVTYRGQTADRYVSTLWKSFDIRGRTRWRSNN